MTMTYAVTGTGTYTTYTDRAEAEQAARHLVQDGHAETAEVYDGDPARGLPVARFRRVGGQVRQLRWDEI